MDKGTKFNGWQVLVSFSPLASHFGDEHFQPRHENLVVCQLDIPTPNAVASDLICKSSVKFLDHDPI